ncbi:MAG: hypothetical protein ACYTG7_10510 [Planctomycetota bacterium]|jgi:hypothetical protein
MVQGKPLKFFFGHGRFPKIQGWGRQEGSVLIPCLLFLSLLGLTAVGFLTLTRSEIRVSQELDGEYKARLSGQSAHELAQLMLATDPTYTGGTGIKLPWGGGKADIAVVPQGGLDHTIQCTGYHNDVTQFQIDQTLAFFPRLYNYALAVGGNLTMNKTSRVLGDVHVTGTFKGESTALVTGDIYLHGSRAILKDLFDKVIQIDGYTVPEIQGKVYTDQDQLGPLSMALDTLKALAQGQGQYYTKNTTIKDQDLTGVVYLEEGKSLTIENLTLRGVLVVGSKAVVPESPTLSGNITVKMNKYCKIVSDPAVLEDVAIIAPDTYIYVQMGAYLDVVGASYLGEASFLAGGTAVLTGPTVVMGNIRAEQDYLFQSPAGLRDTNPGAVGFSEFEMTVSEYTEP